MPTVSAICPGQSIAAGCGLRDSGSQARMASRPAIPSGMLIRNDACQLMALVSAPPTSGPKANDAPIEAPSAAKAVARSFGSR